LDANGGGKGMSKWERPLLIVGVIIGIILQIALIFLLLDRPYDTTSHVITPEHTLFDIQTAYIDMYVLDEKGENPTVKWHMETDEVKTEQVIKEIFKP
jgi:hypothetical protein